MPCAQLTAFFQPPLPPGLICNNSGIRVGLLHVNNSFIDPQRGVVQLFKFKFTLCFVPEIFLDVIFELHSPKFALQGRHLCTASLVYSF